MTFNLMSSTPLVIDSLAHSNETRNSRGVNILSKVTTKLTRKEI